MSKNKFWAKNFFSAFRNVTSQSGENIENGHFHPFSRTLGRKCHGLRADSMQNKKGLYFYGGQEYEIFEKHKKKILILFYFGGFGCKYGENSQKMAIFSHFGPKYLEITNFSKYMTYASIHIWSTAKHTEIYMKIVRAVFE